jgi:CheY-like chemotaxis protein
VRILVCLSDGDAQAWLTAELRDAGYEVESAATGAETIRIAESLQLDLIILDMLLPDVDGVAVLRKLRGESHTRMIPVVVVSESAGAPTLESRLAQYNVAGVLRKPLASEDIKLIAGRILDHPQTEETGSAAILVVDESGGYHRSFTNLLKSLGRPTLFAGTIDKGIVQLQKNKVGAVILVLQSDAALAVPLLERAQAGRLEPVPVVVVAESVGPQTIQVLSRYRVSSIVSKPVSMSRLQHAVRDALGDPGTDMRPLDLTTKTVLVVEDVPMAARVLTSLLEQGGYRVRHAGSAESAIRLIEDDPPDLMLLDLTLPGISGIELLHRLAATRTSIPFTVVTGSHDRQKREELDRLGVLRVFEKPVSGIHLLDFMQQFFSRQPGSGAETPGGEGHGQTAALSRRQFVNLFLREIEALTHSIGPRFFSTRIWRS